MFHNVDNIWVCSDFLMTKEKEQFSNRKWVFDLFKRPIFEVSNIEINHFFSSLTSSSSFSRIEFFNLSNIELDIHKTQFLFDTSLISSSSIDYLKTFIPDNILLIGYEFSKETRFILNKANIKYIDFWLHPVRFLDDILFSFSSNVESIYKNLAEFEVNEEYFFNYATRIKIQTYKGWDRNTVNIKPNSAVFIGQTLEDKAISHNNKMLTILDFKEDIEKLFDKYDLLYYIRHPYVKKGDENILNYIKKHPKIQLINYPTYKVLSHNNIEEVLSISSSVTYEAKFFQKKYTFLFQPILNYGFDFEKQLYTPVFQDFVSTYFWSKLLKDFIPVKSVSEKILFFNQKDQFRDMLGFYWSYRQIDKIENMRMSLRNINNKFTISKKKSPSLSKKSKKDFSSEIKKGDTQHFLLNKWTSIIDKYEVISFDIFDTLLIRPFFSPSDLFSFMEKEVFDTFNISHFKSVRNSLRTKVSNHSGEEIDLITRYNTLVSDNILSSKKVSSLMQLELNYEEELLSKRPIVFELYKYALSKNKKIIFTSDTFFSRSFIQKILNKNDFSKYDYLFLSSETNTLKSSGNLFLNVLDTLNISSDNLLHIGDNYHSDINMASKLGINSIYIESISDNFKKHFSLNHFLNFQDKTFESIVKGLFAKKMADIPNGIDRPSFVNGDTYLFGYGLAGLFFYSFIKSLIEKSIEDNIDTLYFLSRDGDIIKKVYDIYSPYFSNAPKSKYIYASRRSLSVASIFTKEQAISLVNKKFIDCEISKIIFNRFGISIPDNIYNEVSLSPNSIVHYHKDILKINKLVDLSFDLIIERAAFERSTLLKYYDSLGLNSASSSVGIVDIGHEGSLQHSLYNLLNIKLNGYYFATFPQISSFVEQFDMTTWGFVGNKIKDTSHFYRKNILFFENIFLNSDDSFLFIDNENNPVFLSSSHSDKRKHFATLLHSGIVDFNSDLVNVYKNKIVFNHSEPIQNFFSPILAFLDNPSIIDLKPFINIPFENTYNCRDFLSIISINSSNIALSSNSIWNKGVEVYNNYYSINFSFLNSFDKYKRLFLKFKNNPYLFFKDSKYSFLRNLSKKFNTKFTFAASNYIFKRNKHFFQNNFRLFNKKYISSNDTIVGWGLKDTGFFAMKTALENNCNFLLCEDGFYRSIKTGLENELSISIVKDDIGIYYDATKPSLLENLLNDDTNFNNLDIPFIQKHLDFIIDKKLSKYNSNISVPLNLIQKNKKNLLFISQTAFDSSLEFGLAYNMSDKDIISDILLTYPPDTYNYFVKVHPEVLLGNKDNDIDINLFKDNSFTILSDNYNPIDLLNHFDIITTKTSGMGFEALLLNKTVVCYGAPFYSNWGLTIDKVKVKRRIKKRSLLELFYASTFLYTTYVNPHTGLPVSFFEALELLYEAKIKNEISPNQKTFFHIDFSFFK